MSVNEVVSHCPEGSDYDVESGFEAIGFHCCSPFLKRQVKSFSTLNMSTIGNDSWIQFSGNIEVLVSAVVVLDAVKASRDDLPGEVHVSHLFGQCWCTIVFEVVDLVHDSSPFRMVQGFGDTGHVAVGFSFVVGTGVSMTVHAQSITVVALAFSSSVDTSCSHDSDSLFHFISSFLSV